jgi:hypothetical protein
MRVHCTSSLANWAGHTPQHEQSPEGQALLRDLFFGRATTVCGWFRCGACQQRLWIRRREKGRICLFLRFGLGFLHGIERLLEILSPVALQSVRFGALERFLGFIELASARLDACDAE